MTTAVTVALVTVVVLLAVHYVVDEVRDRRAWRREKQRRLTDRGRWS